MKSKSWYFTLAILATFAWPALGWTQMPNGPMPPGYAYPPPYAPPGSYGGASFPTGAMGQGPGRYAVPASGFAPDMTAPGMIAPGALPSGAAMMGPMGAMPMEGPPTGAPLSEYGQDAWSNCPDGNCGFGGGCGTSRIWVEAEALFWIPQGRSTPALVTTSPNGTPYAESGVLGFPDTQVLFGNERIGNDWATGFRGGVGIWLGNKQECALWMRGWTLGFDDTNFFAESTGDPLLSRPFFNLETDAQDVVRVAYPGFVEGNIAVASTGDASGGDILGRWALERGEGYRLDFLGGYQSTRIDDNLLITTNLVSTDPMGLYEVGTTIEGFDSFQARNTFNGGVVGLMGEYQKGPWLFRALGKCGIGNMRQDVSINGQTTVTTPPPMPTVDVFDGNLLTQPSNIGNYQQDKFCVVPEINFTLVYQVNCNLDITIGYSCIYWSSYAGAGDSIDTNVNPSDPPTGTPGPVFAFRDSEFWMMGGNVGCLVHW